MKIQADLSVCTTVFKNPLALRAFLASLIETAAPVSLEIIAVDMSEQLSALCHQEFPFLIVYEDPQETHPVRATNRALSLATGRYLSVWDSDACATPHCLQSILDFLDQTPDVGLAGPQIIDAHGRTEPSLRKFPTINSIISPLAPLNLPTAQKQTVNAIRNKQSLEIDWLQSGCHIIRKETFEEIGFFDCSMAWPFAEMDYYFRARRAGWHNYFCPAAKILHANPGRYHQEFRTPLPFRQIVHDMFRYLQKKLLPSKNFFQEPGF